MKTSSPKSENAAALLLHTVIVGFHFILYRCFDLSYFFHFDQLTYNFPKLEILKRQLEAGEFGLWAPEVFGGVPLAFSGTFLVPLAIPLLKIFSVLDTMVLVPCLYFILGGFGFFVLLRRVLLIDFSVAILFSLIWSFNPYLAFYSYDLAYPVLLAWVPIQIFGILAWPTNPFLSVFLFTVSFTDQLFTGRIDSLELLIPAEMLFCWMIATLTSTPNVSRRLSHILLPVLIGTLLSLAILAPHVYDQAVLIGGSSRTTSQQDPHYFITAIINFFHFIPQSKRLLGVEEGFENLGNVSPLLLFSVILALIYERKKTLSCVVVAIVCSLFLFDTKWFGGFNLFNDLYRKLPLHQAMITATRFFPLSLMFLIPIGAIGMQSWLFGERRRVLSKPLHVGFLALFVFLSKEMFLISNGGHKDKMILLYFLTYLVFFGATLLSRHFAIWVGAIAIVSGTHFLNWSEIWQNNYEYVYQSPERGEVADYLSSMKPNEYRVMSVYDYEDQVIPFLQSKGIHSLSGYYIFTPTAIATFLQDILGAEKFLGRPRFFTDSTLAGLANIKYWISAKQYYYDQSRIDKVINRQNLERVFESNKGTYQVYKDSLAVERVSMISKFVLAPKDVEEVKFLREVSGGNSRWFHENVLLPANADVKNWDLSEQRGSASIEKYTSAEITIKTHSHGNILVLTDNFFPTHWFAEIEGNPLPIVRANGLFRAVYVPPGEHKVRFYLRYPSFIYWLSILGCVSISFVAFRLLKKLKPL